MDDNLSRAHALWLSPIEEGPEYEEWCDAQDEKKDLIRKFNDLFEVDLENIDQIDEAIMLMKENLVKAVAIRHDLARLEDTFPGVVE